MEFDKQVREGFDSSPFPLTKPVADPGYDFTGRDFVNEGVGVGVGKIIESADS